ncbi:hypothetical protein Pla22_23010 [Rubripirellula amarantea]|uniref:Uncharacterized protein n=1 Tax=Rubripirellula amarantea TaxID=2527999 RepID=A0A5C5WWX7_9BACT|nr:hypothetical protein [Rubripirellula amarantea]TWT54651.1 hypothetical protein Pla22_23010 [Rubripirellula amarantea]
MKRSCPQQSAASVAIAMLLLISIHGMSSVQSQSPRLQGSDVEYSDRKSQPEDGVPASALLTDHGRALAEELRNLRRTRSNLGEKHPTRSGIDRQINDILLQLKAFVPAEPDDENPFLKQPNRIREPLSSNPAINDTELRQLVLRLNERVNDLEYRLKKLEAKNK